MRYKIFINTGILLAMCLGVHAQNSIEKVLSEIEKNNSSLRAFQQQMEADKIGNRTGIYLTNPEVEFNYLWGSPSAIGNRKDISVSQSFDFPTAYAYRNRIATDRNQQAELEYRRQQKDILFEARQLCVELTFTQAMQAENRKRLQHARELARSYRAKLNAGDANILDDNKAQLNLLGVQKEAEQLALRQEELLSELKRMNGGESIAFADSTFSAPLLPSDFESWYAQAAQANPVLAWLATQTEISRKQEKLNRAMSLPKIQTGYMSEKVVGEQFQGITLGLSIPLWENKNTVKQARQQTAAMQSMEADQKLQWNNHLKILHSKAVALQQQVSGYRQQLQALDHTGSLQKALNAGEINLVNYLLELTVYYEHVDRLLDTEHELHSTLTDMNRY